MSHATPHIFSFIAALCLSAALPLWDPPHLDAQPNHTHATPQNTHTQRTRRRRRRRKKRLHNTNRVYFQGRFLSPSSCFQTSAACPANARLSLEDAFSWGGAIGYRWTELALEFRIENNHYHVPPPDPDTPFDQHPEASFYGSMIAFKLFPFSRSGEVESFILFGTGYMLASDDIQPISQDPNPAEVFGHSWVLGTGVDAFIARPFAVGFEFDLFFIPTDEIGRAYAGFWSTRMNFTLYSKL